MLSWKNSFSKKMTLIWSEQKKSKNSFDKNKMIKKIKYAVIWLIPENNSLWELIYKFYKIWPHFQWGTSLLTLVLIYWVSGYYYNKFLSKKGGWMDTKTRIFMICLDLTFNFLLGIYYMNYRDTFLGALMVQCPVFLSPVFWLLELICFYIYYRWIAKSFLQKKKNEFKK